METITEMFAFIAVDETGEGVLAVQTSDGMMMPLVGADLARIDSLRPIAQQLATAHNQTIKLIKFTVREELEVIRP